MSELESLALLIADLNAQVRALQQEVLASRAELEACRANLQACQDDDASSARPSGADSASEPTYTDAFHSRSGQSAFRSDSSSPCANGSGS